ncbi:hypothetical protein [Nocardioides dilutus]
MTSTPTPPPADPAGTTPAASTPVVPYGPPVTEGGSSVPDAAISIDLSRQSVAGTAGKWAIRLLLPLIIRAIFRAIFR